MPSDRISADSTLYKQYYHRWQSDLDRFRTKKWPLFDFGAGLMALAASVLIAIMLLGIRTRSNIANLTTPRHPWKVLAVAAITWAAIWAIGIAAILQGFFRHEYPWWADTIIIPMFAITAAAVVFAPIMLALIWLGSLRRADLPAPLWTLPSRGGFVLWSLQLWWLALTALGVYLLVAGLRFGPFALVPASLCIVYIGLVARAAAATRHVIKHKNAA